MYVILSKTYIRSWIFDFLQSILKRCGLGDKIHVNAHALSGGMKRKLSMAIALCGNSEVVILDEPSAGIYYTSTKSWGDYIFTSVCLCVCECV